MREPISPNSLDTQKELPAQPEQQALPPHAPTIKALEEDVRRLEKELDRLGQHLGGAIEEHARRFGEKARAASKKVNVWSGDVEDKVRADWERTSAAAHSTWEKVRAAVKEGFNKAKKEVKPATKH